MLDVIDEMDFEESKNDRLSEMRPQYLQLNNSEVYNNKLTIIESEYDYFDDDEGENNY
jgi:hypothetical protein